MKLEMYSIKKKMKIQSIKIHRVQLEQCLKCIALNAYISKIKNCVK